MMERRYGMFVTYGMNTYLDVEWSEGKVGVEAFDPPGDLAEKVDGWAALAKAAGMRYLLYVTKHHDGFCTWPTKWTDYHSCVSGVKHKVDVVGAVAEACRRHGIELALYYSIWDRHELSYRDADKYRYIKWMKGQLRELLTQYGEVCELWLDGQWDRKCEEWYLPEVYGFVKGLQPGCQVGVNHTVDKMPGLQREGGVMSYWPSDFRLYDPYLPAANDPKIFVDGQGRRVYLPFEATVTMSPVGNWFAHEGDPLAMEVEWMEEILWRATQGGNVLVMNVSPRKDGTIFEATRRNLMSLAERVGLKDAKFPELREPKSLTFGADARASSWMENELRDGRAECAVDGDPQTAWMCGQPTGRLEVMLRKPGRFNQVVLVESTRARIGRFTIEAEIGGKWEEIYRGDGVSDPDVPTPSFGEKGHATLSLGREVVAEKVRVNVLSSAANAEKKAMPGIYRVGLCQE